MRPRPTGRRSRPSTTVWCGRHGLSLVDALAGRLDGYHLHAACADLLRRLGRDADAAAGYERALALVGSAPERRFLEERLSQARGRVGGAPAG